MTWMKDYQEFLSAERATPPSQLTRKVKSEVRAEMNPSSWKVFSKLFAIQFMSATFTLILCLTFDIHVTFFKLGEIGCLMCGGMFLGFSGMLSTVLLRRAELNRIRHSRPLQLAMVSFLSLGLFFSIQEKELVASWTFVAAWVIGSVLGGGLSLEVGLRWRLSQPPPLRSYS